MPEFLPFTGTRYNPAKVRIDNVIAPPYDVISTSDREELYQRDPYNVIRLILNKDSDPYTSASSYLQEWIEENILIREEEPSLYVYYQMFTTPEGREVTRTGVMGKLKLEPYSTGNVLPHERTLAGPKKDRYQLMQATNANLSPIYGLIDDPSLVFDQTLEIATIHPALADVEEKFPNNKTVRHLFWKLTDEVAINRITSIVRNQKVMIADGHHRYETALKFSTDHPENIGAQYMMVFLSNIRGEGSVILPTHRVLYGMPDFNPYRFLEGLRSNFDIQVFSTREEGVAALERDSQSVTLIDAGDNTGFALVRNRDDVSHRPPIERLPVYQLQEEVLKPFAGLTQEAIDEKRNLLYPHTLQELDEMTDGRNDINASFILRAITANQMIEVMKSEAFMPQKSTFFYPKLLSGLVFHEFAVQNVEQGA